MDKRRNLPKSFKSLINFYKEQNEDKKKSNKQNSDLSAKDEKNKGGKRND